MGEGILRKIYNNHFKYFESEWLLNRRKKTKQWEKIGPKYLINLKYI